MTESGEDKPDEFTQETLNDAVELIEGCQDADFAIFKDCDRQAVHEALNQRWLERKNKIAESQAQTKKNPVQNESKILDRNRVSGQENKPDEFTLESLNDVVELLQYCEDAETLEYLRDAIAPTILKEAAKLLSDEKATQIRQWVYEQNTA